MGLGPEPDPGFTERPTTTPSSWHTLHTQARTTPKIRAEIQSAPPAVTNAALARRYGVTAATIAKWRSRDGVQDRSHRPHTFHSTLTPAQEAIVVAVRELLLLSLDDLLVVAREFLCPHLSRSALDRCRSYRSTDPMGLANNRFAAFQGLGKCTFVRFGIHASSHPHPHRTPQASRRPAFRSCHA